MRRLLASTMISAVLLGIGATPVLAAEPTIEVTGTSLATYAWTPSTAEIDGGGSVTFKNATANPHGLAWQSGPETPSCTGTPSLGQGNWAGSCSFASGGTYAFYCPVHPAQMKGTIVVDGPVIEPPEEPPPPEEEPSPPVEPPPVVEPPPESSDPPPPPASEPLSAPAPVVVAPAPDTKIILKPAAKTKDRTPTVKFKATVAGATYRCSIDSKPSKACRSPFTVPVLKPGRHTIRVVAVAGGIADPTPAVASFKILAAKKR